MSPSPERPPPFAPPGPPPDPESPPRLAQSVFVFRDTPPGPFNPRPDPPNPIPDPDPEPPMEKTTSTTFKKPIKMAINPPGESKTASQASKVLPASSSQPADSSLTPPDSPRARPRVPFPAGGPSPDGGSHPHSHAVNASPGANKTAHDQKIAYIATLLRKLDDNGGPDPIPDSPTQPRPHSPSPDPRPDSPPPQPIPDDKLAAGRSANKTAKSLPLHKLNDDDGGPDPIPDSPPQPRPHSPSPDPRPDSPPPQPLPELDDKLACMAATSVRAVAVAVAA